MKFKKGRQTDRQTDRQKKVEEEENKNGKIINKK